MVSDYTGLNFNEAIELDCLTFKKLYKDGFIHTMTQSEEGREYLENAWNIRQTTPDRKRLRKQFNRSED